MGTNGVETIMTGNARITVEGPKQFEAFGSAVHHSGCDWVIESDHGTGGDSFQQLIQSQDLWPVGVLNSRSFVVNGGNRCLKLIQAHGCFRQRGSEKLNIFGDLRAIPQSSILFI